jgi:Mrp family chromosome partitioning ATPase/capsular polysaccharide biosynthesis protein
MNSGSYLRLFRRWFWLIGLAVLVSGGSALLIAQSQPPVYQAAATVQIGPFQEVANPDPAKLRQAESLASAYFALAKTKPFLTSVITRSGLSKTTDELAQDFTTAMIPDTPFFTVTATGTDPQTIVQISNAVADEFVAQTASISENRKKQIASIQGQIDNLSKDLDAERKELAAIGQYLKGSTSADPILVARQNDLVTLIAQQQATLAQFQNSLITLQNQGNLNEMKIIEKAVPNRVKGISIIGDMLLAGGIGGALSIGLIALLEQLNTTIRTSDDIRKAVGLPTLGTISVYGSRNETSRQKLVTHQPLRRDVLESYRLLHARLMTISQKNVNRGPANYAFIISSPAPGDGKSVISANLAVTAALFGLRVLLVDADLRQPALHAVLGLANETGLAKLLAEVSETGGMPDAQVDSGSRTTRESPSEDTPALPYPFKLTPFSAWTVGSHSEDMTALPYSSMESYVQYSDLANFMVMTSGPITEASSKQLIAVFGAEWLATMKACTQADIVIIDTPPCLAAADSSILALKTGANVIMVLSAGQTSMARAAKAVEQFTDMGANVEGIVLNRVDPREKEFAYGDAKNKEQ